MKTPVLAGCDGIGVARLNLEIKLVAFIGDFVARSEGWEVLGISD